MLLESILTITPDELKCSLISSLIWTLIEEGGKKINEKIFSTHSIEELLISKTDFTAIVREEIDFCILPEIDDDTFKKIERFFNSDVALLTVQKLFTIRYDGDTLEDIKNEFRGNFGEYIGKDAEISDSISEKIFNVLCEGCFKTLDKAIKNKELIAHDQKQILFLTALLNDVSQQIIHQGETIRQVVLEGNKEILNEIKGKQKQILRIDELNEQIKQQLQFTQEHCSIFDISKVYTEIRTTEILQPLATISSKPPNSLALNAATEREGSVVVSKLVNEENHIILTGESGSGKTTTLRWLNSESAKKYQYGMTEIVPVYINLAEYNPLDGSFEKYVLDSCKLSVHALEMLSKQMRLLYLLDGLDVYSGKSGDISRFLKKHHGCRVVISSRPNYSCQIESSLNCKAVKLEPLSDPERNQFIKNYLPGKENTQLRKNLYCRIKNDSKFRELCKIPLLLYIIIRVASDRKKENNQKPIPNIQTELYKEFISNLWHHAKESAHFAEELAEEALTNHTISCLSFWMQCENTTKLKIEDALRLNYSNSSRKLDQILTIGYKIGLLVKNGDFISIGFHQSFQEYFAAIKLKELFENGKNITPTYTHLQWKDVVVMASEIVDEPDKFVEDVMSKNLFLAAKCLARVSEEKKIELINILHEVMKNGRNNEKQYSNIYDIPSIVGTDNPKPSILDYYNDIDSNLRSSAAHALGHIGAVAVTPKLIEAFSDKKTHVRNSAVDALVKIGKAAVPKLIEALSDENPVVKANAAHALGKIGAPEAVPKLIDALSNENLIVKINTAEALGKIGTPEAVSKLIEALSDENPYINYIATLSLGEIGAQEAVPKIIEALFDEKTDVKTYLADLIGELGAPGAATEFINNPFGDFINDIININSAAGYALNKIGATEAVPILIEALSDEKSDVKVKAAYTLGKINASEAVPKLIEALSDESPSVNIAAAHALGEIGAQEAVPILIEALSDRNPAVKVNAAYALGEIGAQEAVPILIEALSDGNPDVKTNAAYALGEIGAQEAVPKLIEALSDGNPDVKTMAAYALSKIGAPEAVPKLIENLSDVPLFYKHCLEYALHKIVDVATVTELIGILSDENLRTKLITINILQKTCEDTQFNEILDYLVDCEDSSTSIIGQIVLIKIIIEQNQNKKIFKDLKMDCN